MKIEVRYRHADDTTSVYMTTAKGDCPLEIGESMVMCLDNGEGVYHERTSERFREHVFRVVYDHDRFFVEVIAIDSGDE